MAKELLAALIGGVIGVAGSLLSVAIGYYLHRNPPEHSWMKSVLCTRNSLQASAQYILSKFQIKGRSLMKH